MLARTAAGVPDATNPDGHGHLIRSFHMPTPCQLDGKPSQDWNDSHTQFAGGTNQGFVVSNSGPVAMGYFTPADLPFTNSLAATYPLADRYFCSVLGADLPQPPLPDGRHLARAGERFVHDRPPAERDHLRLPRPPRDLLEELLLERPLLLVVHRTRHRSPRTRRVSPTSRTSTPTARRGTCPAFSLVDPDFDISSEENPQDVQYGDVFLSKVVNAVTAGPKWSKTLLVWNYDEHGGYYDHVPPPRR